MRNEWHLLYGLSYFKDGFFVKSIIQRLALFLLSYTNNSKREDLLCDEFLEPSLVIEVLMLWGLSIRANFRNVRKSRAVSGSSGNL